MKKKIFSTLLLVAFAWASTSMFVSCKDYDDDINRKADASVVDALQKTVDQLKADLATCKSNCEAAHATFALKTELAKTDENVKNLQDAVKALQDEMKNLVTAQKLEEALAAAQKALNDAIDKKVDKEAFDELATKVAGIDSKYEDILGKLATIDQKLAAIENLDQQLTILNAYKERVEKLEEEMAGKLNEDQVKALIGAATADFATVEALTQLQALVDAKASGADVVELQKLLKELQGKMEEMSGTILTKEQIEQLIATKIIGISGNVDEETIKGFITTALADYAKKDYVDDKIDSLDNALKDIIYGIENEDGQRTGGLKDQMEEANKLVNWLSPNLNALQYLLDKMITSIVNTNPIMFLGIETVEAPGLAYQPVITPKEIADATNSKNKWEVWYYNEGTGAEYDGAGSPKLEAPKSYKEFINNPWAVIQPFRDITTDSYAVDAEAQYHINPATANLEGWTLSFYTDERLVVEEVESRAGIGEKEPFAKPLNVKANENKYEGGILTVPFTINDGYTYTCAKCADKKVYKGWEAYFHKLICEANVTYAPTINSWPKEGNADDSKGAALRDNVYFIALQALYGAKDTTVTSDYAMVAPVIYHINGLCDNTPLVGKPFNMPNCHGKQGRKYHMYKRSDFAAKNAETHEITFNTTTEIFRFVETHYAYIGFNSDWGYNDKVLDPVSWKSLDTNVDTDKDGLGHIKPYTRDTTMLAKLGLSYRISPVTWYSGKNETDETAHLIYDVYKGGKVVATDENPGWIGIPDSVVVTPRSVVASTGKTIRDGKVADNTREIIEREPMLRIEVIDKLGNTIEVGYMKLKIVEKANVPGKPIDPEVTLPMDGQHYFNCEFKDSITWHQVEGYVLRGDTAMNEWIGKIGLTNGKALNVTKSEFAAHWPIKKFAGSIARFNKYGGKVKVGNDGNDLPLADQPDLDKDPVGVITEKVDGLNRETSVLVWSFSASDYKKIAGDKGQNVIRNKDGRLVNKNPIVTWVMYENDNKLYPAKGDVYVKLVIPAQSIVFPEGVISNYRYGYWYELNSATSIAIEKDDQGNIISNNSDKAMDVHMNVRTPANSYDPNVLTTDEFKKDLFEYFTSVNILSIKDAAHFAAKMNGDKVDWTTGLASPKDGSAPAGFEFVAPFTDIYEYWAADVVTKINEVGDTVKIDNGEWKKFSKADYEKQVEKNKDAEPKDVIPVRYTRGNAVFDAVNNKWNVKGYSGNTYTLKLTARGNKPVDPVTDPAVEIRIESETGKNELVCEILEPAQDKDGNTEIVLKYAENDYAWDILNYAHRHALLNGPETVDKQSFTAYLHIYDNTGCIPVVVENAYFNVKFLRPINWYPQVVDAPIDARTGDHGDGYYYWDLEDFVKFTDWRLEKDDVPDPTKSGWGYPGETYQNKIITGKDYIVVRGYEVKELEDNTLQETTNKNISDKNNEITYWKYYGIEFDCHDDEFYTDIANADRNWVDLNKEPDAINKLMMVKDLKGMDFQFVRNATDPTLSRVKYKNNEGTVDNFHVYVPIYLTYTYGPKDLNWNVKDKKGNYTLGNKTRIKVWGTLSVHKTVHNAAKKN